MLTEAAKNPPITRPGPKHGASRPSGQFIYKCQSLCHSGRRVEDFGLVAIRGNPCSTNSERAKAQGQRLAPPANRHNVGAPAILPYGRTPECSRRPSAWESALPGRESSFVVNQQQGGGAI